MFLRFQKIFTFLFSVSGIFTISTPLFLFGLIELGHAVGNEYPISNPPTYIHPYDKILEIKHFFQTIHLKPLAGSEWALRNPTKLPYETCFIEGADRNLNRVRTKRFFVYSVGKLLSPLGRLVCYTEKLGLGFKIPITIGDLKHFGLEIGVTEDDFSHFMRVYNLDGKTVGQLFGNYKGIEGSVTPAYGIDGQIFIHSKQKNGIQLQNIGALNGIGVAMNVVTLPIRSRAFYTLEEGSDRLILTEGTQLIDDRDDWIEKAQHSSSPRFEPYLGFVVPNSSLKGLVFEKQ